MRNIRIALLGAGLFAIGIGSAWAQISVMDFATTARNRVIAGLRAQIVDVVTAQRDRLDQMAQRLSAHTSLDKYRTANAPAWERPAEERRAYAQDYVEALVRGDVQGAAYRDVARARRPAGDVLGDLPPQAEAVMRSALATLDAADSSLVMTTHQAGLIRSSGRREQQVIDALEADVLDPSPTQSTTAVLDKVSAAVLLETRQKQARLHLLAGVVEQLVIDNKRARDTEAAALNMRLRRLAVWGDEGGGLMTGAADDLRTWKQP